MTTSPTAAAERRKALNTLKTAYKMAHKQHKEANAALKRAQRSGATGLDAMRAKVSALEERAAGHRQRLNELMEEAKAAILATTGKDLKTLKLEAAKAESELIDQQQRLERQGKDSDNAPLSPAAQERELKARQEGVRKARQALHQAMEEQGLSD